MRKSDTCSRSRTANMCVCSANIMTCAKRRRKQMNMRYAKRSEDTEQINVVSWAGWNMNRYPKLKWLFHVPNGGSRNRAEAVKFKQMGVKAGVSDLQLPYPKTPRRTLHSRRHQITTLHKSRLRVRQIVHPVSLQS